jgi:hypothetical protein
MKLPHPDRAVVEIDKLRDYCLNPEHEEGKHKARVFAAALDLTQADAAWLHEQMLAAAFGDATLSGRSRFGAIYMVDSGLEHRGRTATIRNGWIVRHDEDFPRLTTCFVTGKP